MASSTLPPRLCLRLRPIWLPALQAPPIDSVSQRYCPNSVSLTGSTPRRHFSRPPHRLNEVEAVDKLPSMPATRPVEDQSSPKASSTSTPNPPDPEISLFNTSSSQSSQLDNAKKNLPRKPRALQAIWLKPLKRKAENGVPVCDLQLRSYSVRNVEFFADFALRAAYYLGLPASGPVPLPQITERWTVPRSSFIFKKSQENFERITMRRLIQIQDANVDVVEIWLAFLQKHAYHGIGMKANVWQFEELGVGRKMDADLEDLRQNLEPTWAHFGRRKTRETSQKVAEIMKDERFSEAPDMAAK